MRKNKRGDIVVEAICNSTHRESLEITLKGEQTRIIKQVAEGSLSGDDALAQVSMFESFIENANNWYREEVFRSLN